MGVGSRSYGTVEGVGALVPKFSGDEGNFEESTRPNLVTVERWIDQISSFMNSVLSENGFSIPVTVDDVILALGTFVESEVAELALGINGSGRFGPTSKQAQRMSRYSILLDDVTSFIQGNAAGFELLGATRSEAASGGILSRDTDESGDEIFPITQREGFGNVFQDWDV